MATTRLTDIIEPAVYASYKTVDSLELTDFWQAGAIVTNDEFTQKANTGGKIIDMPFWNDLDATSEPNVSSDDPASSATPDKVTADEQIARISYLNNGWEAANLTGMIAGSDPMRQIANRTNAYWARQAQRRLISMATGVYADNLANDSGDMIESIHTESGNSAVAANLFSSTAFRDAAFTLGDQWKSTVAIAVHSTVFKQMDANDDIDFIKDSEGNMTIPTYKGRRVIVDDGMPVRAGTTNGLVYTSILFGSGVFGYGAGTATKPIELDSDPAAGDGAGVETLWERVVWLMHCAGTKFTSSSIAGVSPTLAELALAANWDRVVDRKNIPMAFLTSNG